MATLRIDFGAPQRQASRAGWGVLALAVAAAGGVGAYYHRVRGEAVAIEARLAISDTRSREARGSTLGNAAHAAALRKRAERAVRILDSLEQPWIRLLDDVEAAGVAGIALLALEPDADKRTVRLTGEAADRDTLARYLERLGQAATLREVRLGQHEWQQRGASSALRFVVSARWVSSR